MSNVFNTKESGIIELRSIPWFYQMCLLKQVLLHVSSVTQLFLALCDPVDCSLPGFPVHGIFQARILEWVAMPSSCGSSQTRDQTWFSCIAGRFFTAEPPGKVHPLLSCWNRSSVVCSSLLWVTFHGMAVLQCVSATALKWKPCYKHVCTGFVSSPPLSLGLFCSFPL